MAGSNDQSGSDFLGTQNSELLGKGIGWSDQWVGSYRLIRMDPSGELENFQNFQNFELRFVEDGCSLSIFFIRKSSVPVPTFSTVFLQYPFSKILLQSCIGSSLSVRLPLAPTQLWVCLREAMGLQPAITKWELCPAALSTMLEILSSLYSQPQVSEIRHSPRHNSRTNAYVNTVPQLSQAHNFHICQFLFLMSKLLKLYQLWWT